MSGQDDDAPDTAYARAVARNLGGPDDYGPMIDVMRSTAAAIDLADELANERVRQITDEGYTEQHDDQRGPDGLAALSGQYTLDYLARRDRRRLVQAGAVILAALAAHDRAQAAADRIGGGA